MLEGGTEALRLIVVDDDVDMGALICDVAAPMGFTTQAFASGEAMLNAVEGGDPGMFVVDLTMPDMDGNELLARIAERWPRSKILIISGFDDSAVGAAASLAQARGLEVAGTLTKPVRLATLRSALATLRGDR